MTKASFIMSDKYSERGISFRLATTEDRSKVWEFIDLYFFPGEPLNRSLGAVRNKTRLDKEVRSSNYNAGVVKTTERPDTSILAMDKDGDIVGVMMSFIRSGADVPEVASSCQWMGYFTWMLPQQYSQYVAAERMMTKLDYCPFSMISKYGAERVYVGDMLAVSPKCGGLGLGTELVKRSIELAQKNGCTHYLALLTGLYSQKIYHKYGFQVIETVNYLEEKDDYGNLVIHDHKEHTHAETVLLKLGD